VLYLAWLKAQELDGLDDVKDESEPAVPAGLGNLTAGLKSFMQFFEISPHLVQAAAESSAALEPVTNQELAGAITRLPRLECDSFLLRVLQNDALAGSALRKRLIEMAGVKKPPAAHRSPSLAALSEAAKGYEQDAQRRIQAQAERKRIQELEELAKREEATWPLIRALDRAKTGQAIRRGGESLGEVTRPGAASEPYAAV
jgi:hypothetical protein